MKINELWTQLMADYELTTASWLADELAGATVTATLIDGTTTLTAATSSPWLPWLRNRLTTNASRKASAIAGRAVRVEFVEVGE